jgi:hypothetical protein
MGLKVILISVLLGILSSVLANEVKDWTPRIVAVLINLAASILDESQRERYRLEWTGIAREIPGDVARICVSIGFILAAMRMYGLLSPLNVFAFTKRSTAEIEFKASPGVIATAILLFVVVSLVGIESQKPNFDGYKTAVPVKVFATGGIGCVEAVSYLEHQSRRIGPKFSVTGQCATGIRTVDQRNMIDDDTVAIVVGPLPNAAAKEFRSTDNHRRFEVFLNSRDPNTNSLAHELVHILQGHTAIRAQGWSHLLLNALLDSAVSAELIFGEHWLQYMIIALSAIILLSCFRHKGHAGHIGPLRLVK